MAKYRKKPVIIDAWQWQGTNLGDAKQFIEENSLPIPAVMGSREGVTGLLIHTLEGDHLAQKGDWIIRGVSGEYYPCKPDIFAKTYEKVE